MNTWVKRLRRRVRHDDGVAAVEFAIVAPVLILLVIGMLEFAFVMRDNIAVSSAVRTGARTASTGAGNGCVQGSGATCVPSLAQAAANAFDKAGLGMPQGSIDYIFVYKANASGFPGASTTGMPTRAQCGTTVANCVVYVWSAAANSGAGGFVYSSGAWNSANINACLPTPEQVGVYMKVNHPYLTNMFGATLDIADKAVMKFEPLPANQCAANAHT